MLPFFPGFVPLTCSLSSFTMLELATFPSSSTNFDLVAFPPNLLPLKVFFNACPIFLLLLIPPPKANIPVVTPAAIPAVFPAPNSVAADIAVPATVSTVDFTFESDISVVGVACPLFEYTLTVCVFPLVCPTKKISRS